MRRSGASVKDPFEVPRSLEELIRVPANPGGGSIAGQTSGLGLHDVSSSTHLVNLRRVTRTNRVGPQEMVPG